LKKKEQAAEADVAMSGEDIEVLMAYYENNTSHIEVGYLIQVVRFMYVLKKSCSTP